MSGAKVVSKAGGGGCGITAADRKLINTVKEVATKFSDEEIYAMLKECNRDPNDTVQRLLTQDNFHLVTRKKDRRKETGSTKDALESRQSSSATYGRGGRSSAISGGRGPGRGLSSTRNDGPGVRSKAATLKENGIVSVVKTLSMPAGGGVSYSQLVQPKNSFNNAVSKNLPPSTGLVNGETCQASLSSGLDGGWPANSNYGAPTALQGAWLAGSGHGTIADMLKGNARKSVPPASSSICGEVISATAPDISSLEQFPGTSMHLSAQDSGVSVSFESRIQSSSSAMNCETGAGGLPGSIGDVSSYGLQDEQSIHYSPTSKLVFISVEGDAPYQNSELNLTSGLEEHVPRESGYQNHVADLQDCQPGSLGHQFASGSSYHGVEFAESQKEISDVNWNSQLLSREDTPSVVERSVPDGPSSPSSLSTMARELQELSVRDNHSVIIPDHIRVSDAECTMLSFGSFDVDFDGLSSNSSLRPEALSSNINVRPETASESFAVSESEAITDLTTSMRSLPSSMPPSVPEHEEPISSVPVQNLHPHADVDESDDEEERKEEELAEAPVQHEYPSSYSVIDAVSSDHASHYTAVRDDSDSRPRDVNAVLPQYDNSTYYSGAFRSVPELDSRYSAFSQLAASGKLASSRLAETTGQTASSEVVNASIYPNSNTVGGQTMAAVNNGQSAMSLPQHSMHPYGAQSSGLPLGPFAPNVLGYQYMPPGFSYVQQNPYQHNYVSTNNYHQVPTAVGAGGLKYPMPQYKPAGPVAGGMHSTMSPSSLGYGGYPNSQPAANLSGASSGNTSKFDDAAPQHYKDNSMYTSSQQIDGPSVWLQNQLARDAQNASFYGPPQSQPSRYSQSTSLLTHTHPAVVYANLYHQQQSASNLSTHQLLQQQQGLGSMAALGTQVGSYSQNQRAQPTWMPGPY